MGRKFGRTNIFLIGANLLMGVMLLMSLSTTDDGRYATPSSDDDDVYFTPNTEQLGVWWWNRDKMTDLSYLDFAYRSGVTEIYFNQNELSIVNPNGTFGPNGMADVVEPTRAFIREAHDRGIQVYLLLSNTGTWLLEDHDTHFHQLMLGLRTYQKLVDEAERFAGLHLNIEPNQLRNEHHERYWDLGFEKQNDLMQRLMDFAVMVTQQYGDDVTVDWATGFWWQNFEVEYRGEIMPLHHALITEANRTFVMSFRTNAYDTVQVAKSHIDFAKSLEKPIFLGANIASTEGLKTDQYYHLGRLHMYQELLKIPHYANYDNLHLVVHEIVRWRHWRTWR